MDPTLNIFLLGGEMELDLLVVLVLIVGLLVVDLEVPQLVGVLQNNKQFLSFQIFKSENAKYLSDTI